MGCRGILKDVVGYEKFYSVSSNGEVFSHRSNRYLKQRMNRHGYLMVNLSVKGEAQTLQVHRLVAKAFIPNHDNKPQINHINGAKHDNRVTNLEWATAVENSNHKIEILKYSPSDSEERKEALTGVWRTPLGDFQNCRDAAAANNVCAMTVTRRCRSKVNKEWDLISG